MVPFWGRRTTHFRTYFSGDWDVRWGYDVDFDSWPNKSKQVPLHVSASAGLERVELVYTRQVHVLKN